MARPTGGKTSNVVPLRRGHRERRGVATPPPPGQCVPPVPDVAEAIRSIDRLERHAVMLRSDPPGVPAETGWPIVSYQVELPVVERRLADLRRTSARTWSGPRGVPSVSGACTAAAIRLRAVSRTLHRNPPGTGPLDNRLVGEIGQLTHALRGLRRLLAQQSPGVPGKP